MEAHEWCPGLCPQLRPRRSILPLTLPGFPCPSSSSQIISGCFQSPVPGCRCHGRGSCPCTGSHPHVPGCSACRACFFLAELINRVCEGSRDVLQISKNIRIMGKEKASLTIISERKKSLYLAKSLGFLVRKCAPDLQYPSPFWSPSSAALKHKVGDEAAVPGEGRRAGMAGQAGLGEVSRGEVACCDLCLTQTPARGTHQQLGRDRQNSRDHYQSITHFRCRCP